MNQQSTSDLPPLLEDTVEGQYAEEIKRREKTSYTLGASPTEPTLPRHVKPEDSPISPTPGPRETSTPKTEQRSQSIPKKFFLTTPNHPSRLQKEIPKVTSPIVKIRAKDYNLVFDGNEVEQFIKRVEAAAEIEGFSGEDMTRQVIFMSASEEVKEKIEEIK
ncbi:hypothetical protein O181_123318 [Austropuccinia psidii MF-1]|uniref:Uncharacterized protein n=1 Tax=Austropuccinia psidii MF-1 TaxID=1389203 RepID=A0A9Q3KKX4_9BASI|nr:hypothetical protein [Austropuccinia psidii MF-1]